MNTIPSTYRYGRLDRAMEGVTLIEMMISLTIGLLIIAGIGYAYLGTKQTFRTQDALSRMQEGARTAFEIMSKDIRMAGFRGCPMNDVDAPVDINVLAAAGDWDKNLIAQPLVGYEKATATAWIAFPAGVTGVVANVIAGDALTVLHADNTKEYFVSSHDTGTSQLTLNANHDLQQGEILIVAKPDCSQSAVFQKTNACTIAAGSCGNKIVKHGSSSGVAATSIVGEPFGSGSHVYRLSAVTYYIRNNSNPVPEPSLYRQILGTDSATNTPNNVAQELIEGVQDMQLSYGIDTTATPDGAIDSYVTADAVADWSTVLGIRISLLMVSQSGENITTNPQQYVLDRNGDGDVSDAGETVAPTDKLLRKVFITTISVKNRL
jgi:type IV pilus assembly protein PilW